MFTKAFQRIIEEIIGKTFNSLRFNLLGPDRVAKAFVFSMMGSKYNPNTTLSSVYLHANAQNSTDPRSIDKSTINQLLDISEDYIDTLETKSKSDINRIITQHMSDIEQKAKMLNMSPRDVLLSDEGSDIVKTMKADLKDIKEKIDKSVDLLADHQRYNAQNFGAMDGILTAARSIGIDDPTVMKIGVVDEKLSEMCTHLWHTPGNINKPKVYRMSELKGGEGNPKKGMWEATIGLSHINCFTEGKTPVLTSTGWQPLKNIKMGDLVLTHNGHFKKVVDLINEPYRYKKTYKINYTYNGEDYNIRITPDHKMLTDKGWIEAQHLTNDHNLVSLVDPCIICGSQTETKSNHKFGQKLTCSSECYSKYMQDRVTGYHNDMSEIDKIKRGSNISSAIRDGFSDGTRTSVFSNPEYWTPDRRKKTADSIISRMPQMLISSASTRVSKEQRIVYGWILNEFPKENVVLEHNVDRYAIDIAFPDHKIGIEIDGKYHENERIIKDKARDSRLNDLGWTIIRFGKNTGRTVNKNNIIQNIKTLLYNHNGLYRFQLAKINYIKKTETGKYGRVFCIGVEDDASFVSRGVVSHNCRHVLVPIMPGFGLDESGSIIYKGKDPETGEPWDEYKKQRG